MNYQKNTGKPPTQMSFSDTPKAKNDKTGVTQVKDRVELKFTIEMLMYHTHVST